MIRLRPAEPQDEWAFWELRRQIRPDLTREDHLRWWNEVWEHRYMAYDGPVFVGVIRISPMSPVDDSGLLSLQVTKKEQGKGLGTQMLTAIQRVARDLGFTALSADVRSGNIASQKAFEGAGFEPTRFGITL